MKTDRWLWVLAGLAVIAVAVWFRTWQLGSQILIDDEWHAVHKILWTEHWSEIFFSFGHADYSIPLTLLFNALATTVGLTEWQMRALPLTFGLATVVLVPWLLRPWLKREAMLLLAALLAVSPVLIHFSRYVRPYALVLPLGFMAVIALWRWWHERDRRWLAVYVPCAVLAGWLHPLTLLFTGSAMLYFILRAAWMKLHQGDWSGLKRVIPAGALTLLPVLALVLPPLLADPAAMQSKAGVHHVQLETLVWAWHLVLGTACAPAMVVLTLLALVGAVRLWRRDPAFCGYWLFMGATAVVVVAALQPAWIHHALVLLRYVLVAVPMVFMLLALGMEAVVGFAAARLRGPARASWVPLTVVLILVVHATTGPLAYTYSGLNPFTNHARYYFDFDYERNVFDQLMRAIEVPEVYRTMAREPGRWEIVQGPWWFESNYNQIAELQRQTQMPVRIGMISGLCTRWTHGELRAAGGPDIRFRRFVHFRDLLEVTGEVNRFIVLVRPETFGNERKLPGTSACIDAFRDRYGAPWYEDGQRVIFRVPAGDSD
ncbi:MAG: glycosyltransferase family 39 protein [Wenzhouxiangellaceae bacterium]|nr:glycosyltransferase family 39 protein [Wenzhouxiangellaceae bacterium]